MKAKLPMTEEVRQKLRQAIKNRNDISDLIENYQIKNEILCGAIITRINRIKEDLRNINFTNAVIGEEGKITNFTGSDMRGCNFSNVTFKGITWFRSCDLRNANLSNAFIPGIEFQHADMRNITACGAVIKIGSNEGLNCKFTKTVFNELFKYWNFE